MERHPPLASRPLTSDPGSGSSVHRGCSSAEPPASSSTLGERRRSLYRPEPTGRDRFIDERGQGTRPMPCWHRGAPGRIPCPTHPRDQPAAKRRGGRHPQHWNDSCPTTGKVPAHTDNRTGVPSTTFQWRKVKMKPPPAGHDTARAKRGRWSRFSTWPRRRSLTIEIVWRGGPESWWLVKARGSHGVFPGHMAIEDVMAQVLNEWNGPVLTEVQRKRSSVKPPTN